MRHSLKSRDLKRILIRIVHYMEENERMNEIDRKTGIICTYTVNIPNKLKFQSMNAGLILNPDIEL